MTKDLIQVIVVCDNPAWAEALLRALPGQAKIEIWTPSWPRPDTPPAEVPPAGDGSAPHPQPLYRARAMLGVVVRGKNGEVMGSEPAGTEFDIWREGFDAGTFKARAQITPPGVEPELNVWIKALEKLP